MKVLTSTLMVVACEMKSFREKEKKSFCIINKTLNRPTTANKQMNHLFSLRKCFCGGYSIFLCVTVDTRRKKKTMWV